MLFGQAQKVEDPAAKLRALENFVEHLYPGRWKELRV
jgi:nitroimidazol reductase NimA-like FMN-containing flavoprotein (pyridoxamine 5'-phosphate oxidase superfamily)